jgi:tetratricopeptide (TPR) repeat protein
MAIPGQFTARYHRSPWCDRCGTVVAVVLITTLLGACTSANYNARPVADIAPLQLKDHPVTALQVHERVTTPDLLAVDQEMREFVRRHTDGVSQKRERLMALHRAIRYAATLGIEYDPLAEGTARETFHRRSANCLAYATLFIALAREAGLRASYNWVEVRPEWSRQGERLLLRRHINALVSLGPTEQYVVDIEPLPSRDIVGSRKISDTDAAALYHSNLAMEALGDHDTEQAWLHAVRALQHSPDTAHLWVNLGVIYRANGQHRDAEHSYLHALALDSEESTAMNNLAVLYEIEGRQAEHDVWAGLVAQHREKNPFYHAWLGDQAAADGDWSRAAGHYQRALALAPDDSRFLFALSQSHARLGESAIASGYLQRAVKTAADGG